MMRLILTQEVNRLGGPGDVVEVKDGFGRNYLLPRGFAIPWTRGAQKEIDTIRRARASREIRSLDEAREVVARLESVRVTVSSQAGQAGRLFGSVTSATIADAVKRAGGPDLDRRRIELPNPIKTLGAHTVTVRLHPEVVANLEIDVVAR